MTVSLGGLSFKSVLGPLTRINEQVTGNELMPLPSGLVLMEFH